MEQYELGDIEVARIFATLFANRNVFPILGAGFTKGAKTKQAHVPDASEFIAIMLASLRSHRGDAAEKLSDKPLTQIASAFLNPVFVPTEEAKKIIQRYFVGVELDDSSNALGHTSTPLTSMMQ